MNWILSPLPEIKADELDRKKGMSDPNLKPISNFSLLSRFNFNNLFIP